MQYNTIQYNIIKYKTSYAYADPSTHQAGLFYTIGQKFGWHLTCLLHLLFGSAPKTGRSNCACCQLPLTAQELSCLLSVAERV